MYDTQWALSPAYASIENTEADIEAVVIVGRELFVIVRYVDYYASIGNDMIAVVPEDLQEVDYDD